MTPKRRSLYPDGLTLKRNMNQILKISPRKNRNSEVATKWGFTVHCVQNYLSCKNILQSSLKRTALFVLGMKDYSIMIITNDKKELK